MVSNAFVEFRELSKKNQRIQDKLKGAKDEAAFATLAVKVGAEEGYKFSVEDVHAWAKDRDSLSDEQLNAVSGGGASFAGISKPSPYPETFAEAWYMIFYA
jgi:predicted ribosomally synthesized peptide with nif11-like leader